MQRLSPIFTIPIPILLRATNYFYFKSSGCMFFQVWTRIHKLNCYAKNTLN